MNNRIPFLDNYINIPLLTAEQERDLISMAQHGDTEARNEIINANMRLISHYIWKANIPDEIEYEDLITPGVFGLMSAIKNFDLNIHETRFSTYALWWIRAEITRYIQSVIYPMHIPVSAQDRLHTLISVRKAFYEENFREPTTEELASIMKLPESTISSLLDVQNFRTAASLDAFVNPVNANNHDDTDELGTLLADESIPAPGSNYDDEYLKDLLAELIDKYCSKSESQVLKLRYGLSGYRPMTNLEAAEFRGVSRQRIAQLEKSGIEHLQRTVVISQLTEYKQAMYA